MGQGGVGDLIAVGLVDANGGFVVDGANLVLGGLTHRFNRIAGENELKAERDEGGAGGAALCNCIAFASKNSAMAVTEGK